MLPLQQGQYYLEPLAVGRAALALGVAAAYLPGIFGAATAPRWWVLAVGLPLVVRFERVSVATALLLATVVYAALSLLWAPDLPAGLLATYTLVLMALAAQVGLECEDLAPVLVAFSAGVSVSSLLAVPQALGWSPVFQTSAPAGLFLNSEVLAETAAAPLVWLLLTRRWVLAALLSPALLLCHSRVAALAVGVGLLCGMRPRRPWLRATLVAALLVSAVAALVLLGHGKFASGMDRAVLWVAALYSLTPLGQGAGWWVVAHPGGYEEFAHSDVLQFLVEIGPGALPLLLLPFLALRRARLPEAAALAALCVVALVSFPLHLPATAFLLAVLAGHLAPGWDRVRAPGRAGRVGGGWCLRRSAAPAGGVA